MLNIKRKSLTMCAIGIASALALSGCGYSDYVGHPGHKTVGEAYLPSLSSVVSGYGDQDGTYVTTAKYNNNNWMSKNYKFKVTIVTYHNPVTESYPSRPGIYPDGNKIKGTKGFAGGVYKKHWVATDTDADNFGGYDNFNQSFPLDEDGNWIEPLFAFGQDAPTTEIDNFDFDLQSSLRSASDLVGSLILNNGNLGVLDLSVNAIEFNGVEVAVQPYNIKLDLSDASMKKVFLKNQPASNSILQAILDNTEHGQPVQLKLHFSNGMSIKVPDTLSVMFSHNTARKLLKS